MSIVNVFALRFQLILRYLYISIPFEQIESARILTLFVCAWPIYIEIDICIFTLYFFLLICNILTRARSECVYMSEPLERQT